MSKQRCTKTSQLVIWYREFLEHGKSAAFVSCVSTRYSVATLGRLASSPDHELRRAAALAIGMLGGEESIGVIGACLRDEDRCVRLVAEIAFADLTSRQMGVSKGRFLDLIRRHVDGHRYVKAGEMLEELTAGAPRFANAWHLRGVVSFCVGQYSRGEKFARRAIDLNCFHFAAHSLAARCWLELDQPSRALDNFEKSFAINPSQTAVLGYIDVLKRHAGRVNLDDSV